MLFKGKEEEMERICLQVSSLQLVGLASDCEKAKTMWMTVVLSDAFRLGKIRAGYDDNNEFFQNWSSARLTFLDHLVLHRRERENNTPLILLEDIVGEAVSLYFASKDNFMRSLAKRKFKSIDLSSFRPANWNGLKLSIPVEFIKIGGFGCTHKNGDVSASIQLGHHIMLHHSRIYSHKRGFFFEDQAIEDRRLKTIIEQMLANNKELQKNVLYTSDRGISDLSGEVFIDKAEGCDINSLPPPVSFC